MTSFNIELGKSDQFRHVGIQPVPSEKQKELVLRKFVHYVDIPYFVMKDVNTDKTAPYTEIFFDPDRDSDGEERLFRVAEAVAIILRNISSINTEVHRIDTSIPFFRN